MNTTIRRRLQQHVRSLNKYLTKEWCELQTNAILLCNAHPDDRIVYEKQFKDAGISLSSRI